LNINGLKTIFKLHLVVIGINYYYILRIKAVKKKFLND